MVEQDIPSDIQSDQTSDDPNNKDSGERPWSDIHRDITDLILSNLVWPDWIHFRATCRSWRSVDTYLPPPADTDFPPPAGSSLSQLPYLMTTLKSSNYSFFQPLNNTTFYREKLEGAVVRRSSWGWLLMSGGYRTQFFFNPSTKDMISLPDFPPSWLKTVDVCFSSPPTSPDCMVVAFEYPMTKFGILKRGKDEWEFGEFDKRCFNFKKDCSVFSNGKLYSLGEAGEIGVLDLMSKEIGSIRWNVIKKPLFSWPCYKIRQSFMVECGGGMLAVFVHGEERKLRVKRFDLADMVWRDVTRLEEQALYLSHGGSFLVNTSHPRISNKIYFPRFYNENGVFYCFRTQRYHSMAGDYNCRSCNNFEYGEYSTWINVARQPALCQDYKW